MTNKDDDTARRRPAGSVDGAAMARLFRPSGQAEDRRPWDDEALEIVGSYVFSLDPGVALRRGGD